MYICVTKQKQKTMYTVTTTHQPTRTTKTLEFVDYKKAFLYYSEEVYDKNVSDNAEWPSADSDPDLCAGGRGHDYLIELTKIED